MPKGLLVLLLLFSFNAAHSQVLEPGYLEVKTTAEDDSIDGDTFVIKWTGTIEAPITKDIETAILKFSAHKKNAILDISSPGGSVTEGAHLIEILRQFKKNHKLSSIVQRGGMCASMCVPIFLQGDHRVAARASTWMFHGARKWYTTIPDDQETDKNLIYFREAGVSEAWLQSILPYMRQPGEYWQTGGELFDSKSGLFDKALENHRQLEAKTLPINPGFGPR